MTPETRVSVATAPIRPHTSGGIERFGVKPIGPTVTGRRLDQPFRYSSSKIAGKEVAQPVFISPFKKETRIQPNPDSVVPPVSFERKKKTTTRRRARRSENPKVMPEMRFDFIRENALRKPKSEQYPDKVIGTLKKGEWQAIAKPLPTIARLEPNQFFSDKKQKETKKRHVRPPRSRQGEQPQNITMPEKPRQIPVNRAEFRANIRQPRLEFSHIRRPDYQFEASSTQHYTKEALREQDKVYKEKKIWEVRAAMVIIRSQERQAAKPVSVPKPIEVMQFASSPVTSKQAKETMKAIALQSVRKQRKEQLVKSAQALSEKTKREYVHVRQKTERKRAPAAQQAEITMPRYVVNNVVNNERANLLMNTLLKVRGKGKKNVSGHELVSQIPLIQPRRVKSWLLILQRTAWPDGSWKEWLKKLQHMPTVHTATLRRMSEDLAKTLPAVRLDMKGPAVSDNYVSEVVLQRMTAIKPNPNPKPAIWAATR